MRYYWYRVLFSFWLLCMTSAGAGLTTSVSDLSWQIIYRDIISGHSTLKPCKTLDIYSNFLLIWVNIDWRSCQNQMYHPISINNGIDHLCICTYHNVYFVHCEFIYIYMNIKIFTCEYKYIYIWIYNININIVYTYIYIYIYTIL